MIIVDTSGLATHNYSNCTYGPCILHYQNLSSSASTSPVETKASVKADKSSLSMTLRLFRVNIIIRLVYKVIPLNLSSSA